MDNHLLLSIVIPTHRASEPLQQLTQYLHNQSPSSEIIVVTNGSEILELSLKNVQIFHTEENNPSIARNMGALKARGKFILFLDADAWPGEGALEKLGQQLQEAPSWMQVMQLQVIPTQGHEQPWRAELEIARRRTETKGTFNTCFFPFSFPLLDSCALVCRRSTFLAVGGFPPALKRMEDRALGLHFLKAGIILYPNLEVAIEKRLHSRSLLGRMIARWHDVTGIQYSDEIFGGTFNRWSRLIFFWRVIPPPASHPLKFLLVTMATLEEKITVPLLLFIRNTVFPRPKTITNTDFVAHWKSWRLKTEQFSFFFYFKDQLRVRDMQGVWCSDFSLEETYFILRTFFSDEKPDIPESFTQLALIKRGLAQGWLTRLSSRPTSSP